MSGEMCLDLRGRLALLALVLVPAVALAQPAAHLAWLAGAHATIVQAALHEEAVERGHLHHHGAGDHELRLPHDASGVAFVPAAMQAGPFKDALQATLAPALEAPSSDGSPWSEARDESAPGQHYLPVPHGPPRSLPVSG